MMTQADYERAQGLYLKRPSTVVVTPRSPHPDDIELETQESRVSGGQLIHEYMDVIYESADTFAIQHGTQFYIDWISGLLSTGDSAFDLEHLAWGDEGARYPINKNGAISLVYSPLSKREAADMEAGMGFAGAILHNGIENDVNRGRSVIARWEGWGTDVFWLANRVTFTIARLIVGAYSINTLMNVRTLNVRSAYFGLEYEEMNHKKPTPWSRIGDSTVIEIF